MGVLPAEWVDDERADEEAYGDTDGNLDHGDAEGERARARLGVCRRRAVDVGLVLEL